MQIVEDRMDFHIARITGQQLLKNFRFQNVLLSTLIINGTDNSTDALLNTYISLRSVIVSVIGTYGNINLSLTYLPYTIAIILLRQLVKAVTARPSRCYVLYCSLGVSF